MKNSNKHSKYKRIRKRILSVVMIFCMVLSILPQGMVVFAAGPESGTLANGEGVGHTSHDNTNSISWQAWSSNNSLPTDGGYYYLSTNITINADNAGQYDWEPNGNITLCLNGYTITCNAFINLISGNVTIEDCNDEEGSVVFNKPINSLGYSALQIGYGGAAHLTINGGNFERTDDSRSTIGVYNGSTLTINGGSFTHSNGYAFELNIFDTKLELSGSPEIKKSGEAAGDILDVTGYGAKQGQIKVTGTLTGTFSLCIVDLEYQLRYLHEYSFTSSNETDFNDLTNFQVYDVDINKKGLFNPTLIETLPAGYVARKNLTSGQLEVVERGPKVTLDYQRGNDEDGGEDDIKYLQYSKTETTYYGLPAEPEEPTRKGYTFAGWYEDTEGGDDDPISNDDNFIKEGDHTLYAHWTANTYNVTYKEKNGEEIDGIDNSDKQYTFGKGLTLPTLEREGYTFVGWYTESEFNDSTGPVKSITAEEIGDKTFYASWNKATYKVEYKETNEKEVGGIDDRDKQYTFGDGLTLPTPTKIGYTFVGWYTEPDFDDGDEPVERITAEETGPKTFYAKWDANTYTIIYHIDQENGTLLDENGEALPGTHTYGTPTPLKEAVKKGHTLDGWYMSSDCKGNKVEKLAADLYTDEMKESQTINLYAKWDIATYTVTYVVDGEKIDNIEDEYTSYEYETGLSKLPTLEREGYTFDGWYDNEELKGNPVESITAEETGPKTFYAKWDARTYTIEYWIDGEKIEEDNYTIYTYGEELTLPTPIKTGHDFEGWCTNPEDEGESFTFTTLKDYLPSPEDVEEIVLYAKWKKAKYEVTYKEKEKTIDDIEEQYTSYIYETGLDDLPQLTKTGYDFGGWWTDIDCVENRVTGIGKKETGPKTFYAKWTAKTCTVTFKYQNEGNEETTKEVTYDSPYGKDNDWPTPVREGYEFEGWYTEQNDQVESTTIVKKEENHTLYAHWAKTCIVEFDYNGATEGDEEKTRKVTQGKPYGKLPDPKKTGYSFKGWYTSIEYKDSEEVKATDEFSSEEDQILYAKWEDNTPPTIEPLEYNYEPKTLGKWLIGKERLVITVPAEDKGSGVKEFTYVVMETGESPQKEESAIIQDGKVKIIVNADFQGTIQIKCEDNAGNVAEAEIGLILENNAPAVSFEKTGGTIREDDCYASAPAVEVTVADDIVLANTGKNAISSGIASITYRIDNDNERGIEQTVTGDFTEGIVAQHSFTISPEDIPVGISTITVMVEDNAGNVGEAELIVKVWGTDEDYVTEANERLQEILDNLTVTNDTTKESLEEQLKEALAEEGFEDVTVTVDDFQKDMATTDKEGKIEGTVTVSKGDNSSETTAFDKNIDKLEPTPSAPPEEEPEQVPEQVQDPNKTPNTPSEQPPSTPSTEATIPPEEQEKNSIAMMAGLKVSQTGKKISIEWGKAGDADGYQVYATYCGKKFNGEPVKTVTSATTTKVNVTKIDGKKLNLKKNYKVYVTAYKEINGKKVVIGKTPTGHIVGKNNKAYTNAKEVKVSKSKYTLKVGKSAKIKAKTVLVDKTKKQLSDAHAKEFRYKSTDTSVAVVSEKGKITAKGKGTCFIYVYARNGYAKKVKVTVK